MSTFLLDLTNSNNFEVYLIIKDRIREFRALYYHKPATYLKLSFLHQELKVPLKWCVRDYDGICQMLMDFFNSAVYCDSGERFVCLFILWLIFDGFIIYTDFRTTHNTRHVYSSSLLISFMYLILFTEIIK